MNTQEQIKQWQFDSPKSRLVQEIRKENEKSARTLVVLDDDPTGTQTVHDLPVITSWDEELIAGLFRAETPIFYILTNSRSLSADEARHLVTIISRNLCKVSKRTGRVFSVILRSDSTLRGHHPEEMDALIDSVGKEPDLKILHPAFIEGGRLTFKGIHYAGENNHYLPCGETEYAQDPAFGYESSHLSDWIVEKTCGRVSSDQVIHLSIDRIRKASIEDLVRRIRSVSKGSYLIADALTYYDIDKFCLALVKSHRSFVARTAASFVASMGGIAQRPLLTAEELAYRSGYGGLIIAGSYVDKTTRQLNKLIEQSDIEHHVLDVNKLLQIDDRKGFLQEWLDLAQTHIENNRDLLIYTSRELVTAGDIKESLDIGNRISAFISELVKTLSVTPSFLIAKGGITSSDIATKSLNVKKARIMGQILPGIPVWELGEESKYPGMPYIIFPGNVGGEEALLEALNRIKGEEK